MKNKEKRGIQNIQHVFLRETEIKHNWILFKVKKSQSRSDTILYAYCSLIWKVMIAMAAGNALNFNHVIILEGIDGHGCVKQRSTTGCIFFFFFLDWLKQKSGRSRGKKVISLSLSLSLSHIYSIITRSKRVRIESQFSF